MRGLINDEGKLAQIEETQEHVLQKAGILDPKEIIKIISELTRELDMEVDE